MLGKIIIVGWVALSGQMCCFMARFFVILACFGLSFEGWGQEEWHWAGGMEPQFDEVRAFSEGLAAVKLGGKWGFIDKKKVIVVSFKYDEVKDFNEGLAAVKLRFGWGFVGKGKKDDIRIKCWYDIVKDFSEGMGRLLDLYIIVLIKSIDGVSLIRMGFY